MVDLEIFDPSTSTLLDCIRFYFMSILQKNLQTLLMNGIVTCFRQTETTRHLVDLTLCTFYPIFMELQTTWSASPLQEPTNLSILPALYPLTSLMSLVSLQEHWWIKYTCTCTYIILSKIEEYSLTNLNVFNFASIKFCVFCIFLSNCEIKYTVKLLTFCSLKIWHLRNAKHF